MAFLDPVGLLVFFGGLAAAYGIVRLVRTLRTVRARRRSQAPALETRAERRRRMRDRR